MVVLQRATVVRRLASSMLEPEIQPLVSFVFGRGQIFQPFLLGHGFPLGVTLLVAADIVHLYKKVKDYVHAIDGEQLFVATSVEGCII